MTGLLFCLTNRITKPFGGDRNVQQSTLLHQRNKRNSAITDTDNPQQKIKEVTRLYDNIGVRRLAEDKISELYDSARKYLALVGVAPERKKELDAYASWMMKRSL